MKNKIIYSLLCLAALGACEPDIDSIKKESRKDASELNFSVTQTTENGNTVILKNETEGTLAYWDYELNVSNKQVDTVVYPFRGDYTIKFTGYFGGGPTTDSTTITVAEDSLEVFEHEDWELLANKGEGKQWVWATDHPGGSARGNGPGDAEAPAWWAPGADFLEGEGVLNDTITFSLDGGYKYIRSTSGADGEGRTTNQALFSYNPDNKKLSITGGSVPLGTYSEYEIVVLTENELVIAYTGDGWRDLYLFKRAGYEYPSEGE